MQEAGQLACIDNAQACSESARVSGVSSERNETRRTAKCE